MDYFFMIITKKLVFINFPKTGSSFVRSVIKKIYESRNSKHTVSRCLRKIGFSKATYEELLMPHINVPEYKDQHGTYEQIPIKHKKKKIVSVVRNPYDRFLSLYKFRWWVKNPLLTQETLEQFSPNFPNLTIDEFVEYDKQLTDKFKKEYNISSEINIGGQTIEFIEMFFKNPTTVLENITNTYLKDESYLQDLVKIQFLTQENLNADLADLLENNGYPKHEVSFAKQYSKVNVTQSSTPSIQLTENAIKYVKSTESVLFNILNKQGIKY